MQNNHKIKTLNKICFVCIFYVLSLIFFIISTYHNHHDHFHLTPHTSRESGPGGSSGKELGYRLDGPGSIPGVGGVEIFLHSFVSRLALGSTQPPLK